VELRDFLETRFLAWLLGTARIAGLFVGAPFFAAMIMPLNVRIILFIAMGYMTLPLINDVVMTDISFVQMLGCALLNFLVGVFMGMISYIVFYAVQYGGEIFGVQMGFAMAMIFDPESRTETPMLGQLSYLLATYVFIAIKGHIMLYKVLAKSFVSIPVTAPKQPWDLAPVLIDKMGDLFSLGVQLGLPMIVFMLLVSITLGVVSRIVPQMNVFMVGMPLKVLVGLLMFVGLVGVWADVFGEILLKTVMDLEKLLLAP